MNARKILVMRGGALGDFVLTLPALAALRRYFPEARLEVLGNPQIAGLAVAGGLADGVTALESRALAGMFARGGEWSDATAGWFGGFDVIVSYLSDPEKIFESNVRRAFAGRFIAGPSRPDDRANRHATDVLLEPLRALGVVDADPQPRLALPSEPGEPLGLALHPGSGSERKNWPEQNWSALLDLLLERTDGRFLLVGGEAEGQRLSRLALGRPADRFLLADGLPLVDLARRLRHCRAFVGHDSGVTHLAAALGLPGVVLWGDTPAAVWRPRADGMELLRDPDGLAALPVSAVFAALQKHVAPRHQPFPRKHGPTEF